MCSGNSNLRIQLLLFEQGDYVYVENIEHSIPSNGPQLNAIGIGTTTNKSEDSYVGSGWNSADYDFKFFRQKNSITLLCNSYI